MLKPGGLLEVNIHINSSRFYNSCVQITEDDLTFPCGPVPYPNLTDSALLFTTSSSDLMLGSSQSSLTTPVLARPHDHLNLLIPSPSIGDLGALSPPSPTQYENEISPRDYQRICESWKDMLNHHFITPPISILPFYLNSIFAQVVPQPPLQLDLPQNSSLSGLPQPIGCRDSPTGFYILNSTNESVKSQGNLSTSYALPESVAPLQLARQVHTIITCKDAIWD